MSLVVLPNSKSMIMFVRYWNKYLFTLALKCSFTSIPFSLDKSNIFDKLRCMLYVACLFCTQLSLYIRLFKYIIVFLLYFKEAEVVKTCHVPLCINSYINYISLLLSYKAHSIKNIMIFYIFKRRDYIDIEI